MRLQLCRPLSEAVIGQRGDGVLALSPASIVPPPFGSGYDAGNAWLAFLRDASIVPPPFGSGYPGGSAPRGSVARRFNCAAPFRKRLYCDCDCLRGNPGGFNCAAPFRKRLSGRPPAHALQGPASIVPPPFGSGYERFEWPFEPDFALQLCRPLSEAVIWIC